MIFVILFELLILNVLISWHCDVNYEAGLFLIADQHNVKPIVKQMLDGLERKVPEDLRLIIPDYFFWSYPTVFAVLKAVLSTNGSVYYSGHIVVSLILLGPCKLDEAADNMCNGFCMLFVQPASGILHSVVDLVCHCPGVDSLLLSCHDQSLGVR